LCTEFAQSSACRFHEKHGWCGFAHGAQELTCSRSSKERYQEQELETWRRHAWQQYQQQQQADRQQQQPQQDQPQQQTELRERGWNTYKEWQAVFDSETSASAAPPFDTAEDQDEACSNQFFRFLRPPGSQSVFRKTAPNK
jgi:hypothetical protein